MKATVLNLVLWALLAPAAQDPLADDLAGVQGTWKAWLSPDDFLVFEVNGKRFTMTRSAAGRLMPPWTGELEFDQARNPRQLNWIAVTSAGQKLPDNRCIYEIHGDTWLMIGGGAHDRPERFFCGGGEGRQTLVLKRQKAPSELKAK